MLENEISCPLCTQPINKFGDHATCCAKSGAIIIRNNSFRNLIDSIGTDAELSPVLEKKAFWATQLAVDPETFHSQSGLKAKVLQSTWQ